MNEKEMQEMAVSILLDEYTQLDVAQLLKEYDEAEENDELLDVPQSLDEKCTRMIRREFAKQTCQRRWTKVSRVLTRVAMVTLMLIGMCTVSVLSVKAWREPVLRFVLETFDRRSSISIEGNASEESNTPEDIIEKLSSSIPADFKMVFSDSLDGHYKVRFMGKNQSYLEIIIEEYWYSKFFDTEYADGTKIHINECEAIFINKNGLRIIWMDQDNKLLIDFRANALDEKTFWRIVSAMMD